MFSVLEQYFVIVKPFGADDGERGSCGRRLDNTAQMISAVACPSWCIRTPRVRGNPLHVQGDPSAATNRGQGHHDERI